MTLTRESILRAQRAIGTGGRELDDFMRAIDKEYAPKMIGKYINRNRLIDNDDLRPIFLSRVLEVLPTVNLDRGDPIKYLLTQSGQLMLSLDIGATIHSNIEQSCHECGHCGRITYERGTYSCPHPYNDCSYCIKDFKYDDGKRKRVVVPARCYSHNQVACKTAKSLNKFYYCMSDYSKYIDAIIEDCIEHKDVILSRMINAGAEDPEISFDTRIKRTHVESMYHAFLPEMWDKNRNILTRCDRLSSRRRPICSNCGSYRVRTMETSVSDNIEDGDGSMSSIAEDRTSGYDIDLERIVNDDDVKQFLLTLRGRVKDVMTRVSDGLRPFEIADELGISATAVNIYKSKGFRACLSYFKDEWVLLLGEDIFNKAEMRYASK